MSNQNEIQKQILDAKDNRWLKQKAYLEKYGPTIISFKFNIPHWPKTSKEIVCSYTSALQEFETFLSQKNIPFSLLSKEETALGPEAFIHCKEHSKNIKDLTINFEEEYAIGRLLDIDVLGENGIPIERSTKRLCLLCNDISIICMRNGKHTSKEVRDVFDKMIYSFYKRMK
ncbi:MAG: citrate lyase holo-[acyl-carrier protein] synthase [Candidatus Heimdallarchaeota archaeon]